MPRERLRGYRQAFDAAGLDWSRVHIEERLPYRDPDAGRRAVHALLDCDANSRPTALLAMSDELACGALLAADDRGLAVPRDLSIVGYDDTPTAVLSRPKLTSVHQPHQHKGRAAAERLFSQDPEQTSLAKSVELPTDLVVRESTGPARS